MTLVDDLRAARALIDSPEKWAKGPEPWGYHLHCAHQAMIDADAGYWMDDLARSLPLSYRLSAWFGGRWSILSGANIIRFNDNPKTTHTDVLALFDRAINAALLASSRTNLAALDETLGKMKEKKL